mgnify:CR=1 FL=1
MSNKNQYIYDQIQEINAEIEQTREYLDFAASKKWQYEIARIDLELLKEKRERYQELLAIESIKEDMENRDYEDIDPEKYTKD